MHRHRKQGESDVSRCELTSKGKCFRDKEMISNRTRPAARARKYSSFEDVVELPAEASSPPPQAPPPRQLRVGRTRHAVAAEL